MKTQKTHKRSSKRIPLFLNKNDIFQAILQLLSNKNLAKQMGDESLARAKRYLPCNVSDALSKLYSSLID